MIPQLPSEDRHRPRARQHRLDRMLRNFSWPTASTTKAKVSRILRFEDFQFDPRAAPHEPSCKRHSKGMLLKRHTLRAQSAVLMTFLFGFGMLGFAPVKYANRTSDSSQAVRLGFHRDSPSRRLAHFPDRKPVNETTPTRGFHIGHSSASRGHSVQLIQPGLYAQLEVALDLSLWGSYGVVYNDPDRPRGAYARTNSSLGVVTSRAPGKGDRNGLDQLLEAGVVQLDAVRAKEQCPDGNIRVLVAVVAACCRPKGAAKRQSIRSSWMKIAKEYSKELKVHFFISQPPTEAEYAKVLPKLKEEVAIYDDVVVLPGPDTYMELPRKIMEIMMFALKSPCDYTHVLKIDDDSYLRVDNLLNIIKHGPELQRGNRSLTSPRMKELYIGRPKESPMSGFWPERDQKSKWYLSHDELPVDIAPVGTKYHLGWGYLLSIDLVSFIADQVQAFTNDQQRRPTWWGLLPWEDTIIGVLLEGKVVPTNSYSFRAAWSDCPPDTVVKHLDINALKYQKQLYAEEISGYWKNNTIPCEGGEYPVNEEKAWRVWRNAFPDAKTVGEE